MGKSTISMAIFNSYVYSSRGKAYLFASVRRLLYWKPPTKILGVWNWGTQNISKPLVSPFQSNHWFHEIGWELVPDRWLLGSHLDGFDRTPSNGSPTSSGVGHTGKWKEGSSYSWCWRVRSLSWLVVEPPKYDSMDWFLGENLNRKPCFLPSNIRVSCKFSHHPILWMKVHLWLSSYHFHD